MVLWKLFSMPNEFETFKAKLQDQLDEVDKANTTSQRHRPDVPLKISHSSSSNNRASLRHAPNKEVASNIFVCLSMFLG